MQSIFDTLPRSTTSLPAIEARAGCEVRAPAPSPSIDDLYSARILALAANMPRAGRLAAPHGSAERIAKLCGSRVIVDVRLEGERIVEFAQEVKACALGQAAAAVLGANVVGATAQEIEVARAAFHAMLKVGGPAPDGRFSDLAMLAPIKEFPRRHASSLLAFEATAAACRQALGGDAPRTRRAGAA